MCDQTFSLGTFYEDIYITSAHEGNIYAWDETHK